MPRIINNVADAKSRMTLKQRRLRKPLQTRPTGGSTDLKDGLVLDPRVYTNS